MHCTISHAEFLPRLHLPGRVVALARARGLLGLVAKIANPIVALHHLFPLPVQDFLDRARWDPWRQRRHSVERTGLHRSLLPKGWLLVMARQRALDFHPGRVERCPPFRRDPAPRRSRAAAPVVIRERIGRVGPSIPRKYSSVSDFHGVSGSAKPLLRIPADGNHIIHCGDVIRCCFSHLSSSRTLDFRASIRFPKCAANTCAGIAPTRPNRVSTANSVPKNTIGVTLRRGMAWY